MVSKNWQKIGVANGMPNLPIVRTLVTKTGNVDSLDILKGPLRSENNNTGYCSNMQVFIKSW